MMLTANALKVDPEPKVVDLVSLEDGTTGQGPLNKTLILFYHPYSYQPVHYKFSYLTSNANLWWPHERYGCLIEKVVSKSHIDTL